MPALLTIVLVFAGLASPPVPPVIGSHETDPWCLQWRGTFDSGKPACSSTEIAVWSPKAKRLYLCGGPPGIVRLDWTDVASPRVDRTYEASGVTSVATHDGVVAACHGGAAPKEVGEVLLLDLDLHLLKRLPVGHGPDMLCFTPDGSRLVVANEGEPLPDGSDRPGSVSIIDLSQGPTNARCTDVTFDAPQFGIDALRKRGVLFPHPTRSATEQLEPEYIAIEPDGSRAWVTLQENNAIAAIDLRAARVLDIFPLGTQPFAAAGGGLDPSDKDGAARIQPWPVEGLLQPDSVGCFAAGGNLYLVTANEGESLADHSVRLKDLANRLDRAKPALDPSAFSDEASAGLRHARTVLSSDGLGRLEVCPLLGDDDGDGDYDRLVCFGGRSVTLWKIGGSASVPTIERVWDSGSTMEREVLARTPSAFNADSEESPSMDKRSAKRGPEPEGLTIVEHGGRRLLCVGLERCGGVMMWDTSDPKAPVFAGYCSRRDPMASGPSAGDLAPEGLCVIPASSSPTGEPLLVVCNEFSGTVSLFAIEARR
jgi:hypothetical protein